jgi:hypothetical protein
MDETLSQLIAHHLGARPGPDAGVCYVCGRAAVAGHRRPPSDLFTAWASCRAGDVLCAACLTCIADRRVRQRSWLVTADAFRPLTPNDKGWLWGALLSPPAPPYAFYTTRGGQKQGWLTLVDRVSRDATPVVGTDWTERPVVLDRAAREAIAPLLLSLRANEVSKRELLSGAPHVKTWTRAMDEGWEATLRKGMRWAGDPRWEVMVYACA